MDIQTRICQHEVEFFETKPFLQIVKENIHGVLQKLIFLCLIIPNLFFQRCFTKCNHRPVLQNCGDFGLGISDGRSGLRQCRPRVLPIILRLFVSNELDFLTCHLH